MSLTPAPPAGGPTSTEGLTDETLYPTVLVGGPFHEHPTLMCSARFIQQGMRFESHPEGDYLPLHRWRMMPEKGKPEGELRWSLRWRGPAVPRLNDERLLRSEYR